MGKGSSNVSSIAIVSVFIVSGCLDTAVIGLFPPLFSSMAKELNVSVSSMGFVSAITILFIALSSIVWGYLADKGRRKRLIFFGTSIWTMSLLFTALSQNFIQLITFQIFTGIGLGCIGSIGFSVLSDYIPKKYLGTLMSLWGLSQGFGGILGSVTAPIISAHYGWRSPFIIIAVLGFFFVLFLFFIKEPQKGVAEPELKALESRGISYNYSIKLSHFKLIFDRKSNRWLMLQGFFMSITLGSLLWLPTLYGAKIMAEGIDEKTSLIVAGYFYALLQIGGFSTMYFGYLGDKLQKNTLKGRALLTGSLNLISIPLYVIMFSLPMNNLELFESGNPLSIMSSLINQFIFNPWILGMFLLSVLASAAQSANIPNWLALLTDVNLPEHRATTFSIANLLNGIGRSFGNAFMGIVLGVVSSYYPSPYNYIITMAIFQLFMVPAAFGYFMVSKNSRTDIQNVRAILKERADKLK